MEKSNNCKILIDKELIIDSLDDQGTSVSASGSIAGVPFVFVLSILLLLQFLSNRGLRMARDRLIRISFLVSSATLFLPLFAYWALLVSILNLNTKLAFRTIFLSHLRPLEGFNLHFIFLFPFNSNTSDLWCTLLWLFNLIFLYFNIRVPGNRSFLLTLFLKWPNNLDYFLCLEQYPSSIKWLRFNQNLIFHIFNSSPKKTLKVPLFRLQTSPTFLAFQFWISPQTIDPILLIEAL